MTYAEVPPQQTMKGRGFNIPGTCIIIHVECQHALDGRDFGNYCHLLDSYAYPVSIPYPDPEIEEVLLLLSCTRH